MCWLFLKMAVSCVVTLLFISVHSAYGCGNINFVFDKLVVNKISTSSSSLLSTLSGIDTKNECAARCGRKTRCLSFFYSETTGVCKLFSTLFNSTDVSLVASNGYVYFRPFCPNLVGNYVANGFTNVTSSGGSWIATLTCDSGAIFAGSSTSVTCDADGFWPPMGTCSLTQWEAPSVPFVESVPFAVNVGTTFNFIGTSFGTQFLVELLAGSDIALMIKITSDGVVERSSTVSSVVQGLDSTQSPAFYKPPREFKCVIEVAEKGFMVSTPEGAVFSYQHIIPYASVDRLNITGDVDLRQVKLIR